MSGSELRQRLVAILAADVAGFSRLMAGDEHATVAALDAARTIFKLHVEASHGRVIDMAGDSVLAVFETASGAVASALSIQAELRVIEATVPEVHRMRFRVGVHLCDVIEKADGTIYGDGVNIAARLQGLAEPGGITVSDSVRSAVKGKVAADFEDQGEQRVKNIAEPLRAYRVRAPGPADRTLADDPGFDSSLPDKPSIAVLPFSNMSEDSAQDYFTDGVSEDIITELSRFHSLFVIARNSSFAYKGKFPDIRQVGRELGVRYVLEGSIRRASNRIRVTAQLIDAVTGAHVWAERYDRVVEDIFAVQEEVTRSVVAAIVPQIEDAEVAKARLARPASLSAYEIALRAYADASSAYQTGDRALRDQAIREAGEALEKDSGSLLALTALAWAQWQHVMYRTTADRERAWQDGMSAVGRALALDRSDHRAYQWKGMLLVYVTDGEIRWDEAIADLRRAHELNPNDAFALAMLGWGEAVSGNPSAGIECLARVLRLNPRGPRNYNVFSLLSIACFLAYDYEQALHWAGLASREAPNFPQSHLSLVAAHVALGRIEEAKRAFETARRVAPEVVRARLEGTLLLRRKAEDREREYIFLRVAAGLEDPSAADAVR